MKSTFRQTTHADSSALGAFLTRIFAMPADNLTARADNLHWKYWTPHPRPWHGSRSGVLERAGAIVAHGGAWPLRLRTFSDAFEAIHLIDWAADPAAPGAGLSVLTQMARRVDVAIAVGGTEMTQRILPRFGFQPHNTIRYYARPLRPLQQALTHQDRTWKTPARIVRSLVWRYLPPLSVGKGWSACRIEPASLPASVLPRPSGELAVFERSPELFQYLGGCPVAACELYLVERDGRRYGYFCLFLVPGTARIADAWAVSPEAWRALFALAATTARRRGACEIVTASAMVEAEQALRACGYRVRNAETLVVYDPANRIPRGLACNFQMIDSDIAFLHAGTAAYVT
jgi:hypothetical protein